MNYLDLMRTHPAQPDQSPASLPLSRFDEPQPSNVLQFRPRTKPTVPRGPQPPKSPTRPRAA